MQTTRTEPVNPDQLHVEIEAALGHRHYGMSLPDEGGCIIKHEDADEDAVKAVLSAHDPTVLTQAQKDEVTERNILRQLGNALQDKGWDGLTPNQRTQIIHRLSKETFKDV